MKALLHWLKSWWVGSSVAREVLAMNRVIARYEALRVSHRNAIEAEAEKLLFAKQNLEAIVLNMERKLDQARNTERQYEHTVETLRERLDLAENTLIPLLEAGYKKHLAIYDTEVAIENRKAGALTISGE